MVQLAKDEIAASELFRHGVQPRSQAMVGEVCKRRVAVDHLQKTQRRAEAKRAAAVDMMIAITWDAAAELSDFWQVAWEGPWDVDLQLESVGHTAVLRMLGVKAVCTGEAQAIANTRAQGHRLSNRSETDQCLGLYDHARAVTPSKVWQACR